MDVKIILEDHTDCEVWIENGKDSDHIILSLNNGSETLYTDCSIEELKHALRKISCK